MRWIEAQNLNTVVAKKTRSEVVSGQPKSDRLEAFQFTAVLIM
jgi:hypothetical protein